MSEQKVWKEDGDIERESMSTGTPPGVEKKDESLGCQPGFNPQTKELSNTPASIAPDEPPNGGYGWVCTICCATINAHTWGLNSSYGVFLAHYLANNTFPGASYLEYAFVGSLSISCAMLVSPLATFTTRVYGTRTTLFIGIGLETASLIGASFASTIWQLFLSQGICFGFGMGFLFVGSVGIVPQWFTTRRSLANGFSTCGSGLGGLIYSLATGAMLQTIGLAWAFRVLGIVACIVNTICSLLIRDRNKAVGSSQLSFDHKLFKRPEYLLLCGYGWFSILAYVVLIFSLANYANAIGLSASQAAIVSALFNLGQAFGRPPIGYFSDSIGRINMAGMMTLLSGVFALLIWVFAKSYGVLVFYSLIGGTVAGTFWATIAPVTAEVVGLRDVPSALNLIWLVIVLPCTFSEPIALEIVGGTGEYIGAQLFTGFMYVAAAMCLLGLRGWKIGEVEEVVRGNGTAATPAATTAITATTAADTAASAGGGGVVAETISLTSRKAGRKVMLSRCLKWKKV